MQKIFWSLLLAASMIGVLKADDIMMSGPIAEKVKREILDLNKEMIRVTANGPAAADFFERHEVDSIIYLGPSLRSNMTKAQVVNEWRTGKRKMVTQTRDNERVRVYDNGNVAVYDYIGEIVARYNGQDVKRRRHTLEVYVKHNGVWRTVVHDGFEIPNGTDRKVE